MVSLALNKSSLKSQRDQLNTFQRFLPALDLKRQQLSLELKKAEQALLGRRREIDVFSASLEGLLRLIGADSTDWSGYVKVRSVKIDERNVLGVKLPRLQAVEFEVEPYPTLATPFWLDALVECVQRIGALRIRKRIDQQCVVRLARAVRQITQRVNLFEKVLIPNARENIHRIEIYLADAERAAIVRSKIVKGKRQRRPDREEQH